MAGLRVPLSTLRQWPYDRCRMTRGPDEWLAPSGMTLSFTTPRQSPGAPTHPSGLRAFLGVSFPQGSSRVVAGRQAGLCRGMAAGRDPRLLPGVAAPDRISLDLVPLLTIQKLSK